MAYEIGPGCGYFVVVSDLAAGPRGTMVYACGNSVRVRGCQTNPAWPPRLSHPVDRRVFYLPGALCRRDGPFDGIPLVVRRLWPRCRAPLSRGDLGGAHPRPLCHARRNQSSACRRGDSARESLHAAMTSTSIIVHDIVRQHVYLARVEVLYVGESALPGNCSTAVYRAANQLSSFTQYRGYGSLYGMSSSLR
jgi:hypothetical protein